MSGLSIAELVCGLSGGDDIFSKFSLSPGQILVPHYSAIDARELV